MRRFWAQLRTAFEPQDEEWQAQYRALSRVARVRVQVGPASGPLSNIEEASLVPALVLAQRRLWVLITILSLPMAAAVTFLVRWMLEGRPASNLLEDPEPILWGAAPGVALGVHGFLVGYWAAWQNQRRISGKINPTRFTPLPFPPARQRWIGIGVASLMVVAALYVIFYFRLRFTTAMQLSFEGGIPFWMFGVGAGVLMLVPFVLARFTGHRRFVGLGINALALGMVVTLINPWFSHPSFAILAAGFLAIRAPSGFGLPRALVAILMVGLGLWVQHLESNVLSLVASSVALPLIGAADEISRYTADQRKSWSRKLALAALCISLLATYPLHSWGVSALFANLPQPRPAWTPTGNVVCKNTMTMKCAQTAAQRAQTEFAWIPGGSDSSPYHEFTFAHPKLSYQSMYTTIGGKISLYSHQVTTEAETVKGRKPVLKQVHGKSVRIYSVIEEGHYQRFIFWEKGGKTYEISSSSFMEELITEEDLMSLIGKVRYTAPSGTAIPMDNSD